MNPNIAFQILELAVSLLRTVSTGAAQSDAASALTLTEIVRVAAKAYQTQFGQPIDLSLIKPEAGI
jgi:hypothetical protein